GHCMPRQRALRTRLRRASLRRRDSPGWGPLASRWSLRRSASPVPPSAIGVRTVSSPLPWPGERASSGEISGARVHGGSMLLNLREASGPLYRRVYHALKAMIRAGRLGPAARLPSTRVLARDLGVSRNTVMLAYEQLAAEGYLVSRHRGTTSVAAGVVPAPRLGGAVAAEARGGAAAFRLCTPPHEGSPRAVVALRGAPTSSTLRLPLWQPLRGRVPARDLAPAPRHTGAAGRARGLRLRPARWIRSSARGAQRIPRARPRRVVRRRAHRHRQRLAAGPRPRLARPPRSRRRRGGGGAALFRRHHTLRGGGS